MGGGGGGTQHTNLLADTLAHLFALGLELSVFLLARILSLLKSKQTLALLLLELGTLLGRRALGATDIG